MEAASAVDQFTQDEWVCGACDEWAPDAKDCSAWEAVEVLANELDGLPRHLLQWSHSKMFPVQNGIIIRRGEPGPVAVDPFVEFLLQISVDVFDGRGMVW